MNAAVNLPRLTLLRTFRSVADVPLVIGHADLGELRDQISVAHALPSHLRPQQILRFGFPNVSFRHVISFNVFVIIYDAFALDNVILCHHIHSISTGNDDK